MADRKKHSYLAEGAPHRGAGKNLLRQPPAKKLRLRFPEISRSVLRALLLILVIIAAGALLCRAYYSIRARMLVNKGRALQAQKKWAEAESAYKESLYFDRHSSTAYSNLGECSLMSGDLTRAELYLGKATACKRVDGKGYYYMGSLYSYSGHAEDLEKIIRESSERIIITDKLYMDLLRVEAAIIFPTVDAFRLPPQEKKLLMDKLQDTGNSTFFIVHAGLVELYHEDFKKAKQLFRHLVSKNPGNSNYWVYLALACGKNGEMPEALKHIQEALRLDDKNARAYEFLGVIYMAEKLPDDAARAFAMSLSLDPGSAGAHYYRGLLCFEQGDYREARKAFEQSIALQPNFGDGQKMKQEVHKKLKINPGRSSEKEPPLHVIDADILKGPLYYLAPPY